MKMPSIAMVVPSFNNMPYLRRTITSFQKYTPGIRFIVVDDASVEWDMRWRDENPEADVTLFRYQKNGQLTRSWNKGYEIAKNMSDRPEYLVLGNNDILGNAYWWKALVDTLNSGFDLTGPLSNAAGVTAHGKQDVRRYVKNYKLTDDPDYLNALASGVWSQYGVPQHRVVSEVNGFFMMGKMQTFVDNEFADNQIFQPVVKFMPSGSRNATPLMTGNEDELQHRWRNKGLKSAVSSGSFVFHYRSVSRGRKWAKAGWMRCDDFEKPV